MQIKITNVLILMHRHMPGEGPMLNLPGPSFCCASMAACGMR